VVNAQPMLSGRFPNLGPQVLAEAGVTMVDSIGDFGFTCLADGRKARVHEGQVYDGEQRLTEGRCLDLDGVLAEMERARGGMLAQLETFTHNSTEFLRREQQVLLHGEGLPRLTGKLAGRPAVVVSSGEDLRRLKHFVKEQRPVVVATGAAADAVAEAGWRIDALVIGADLPDAKVVREARDVILVDGSRETEEALSRAGATVRRADTALSEEDVALLLAFDAEASVIVRAGGSATLTDYLERQRPGLASSFLTRLAVGPTLVDANAVGTLYSGRVKGWQVMLTLIVCVLMVAAALAMTDQGQQWAQDLGHHLAHDWHELKARAQGRHL